MRPKAVPLPGDQGRPAAYLLWRMAVWVGGMLLLVTVRRLGAPPAGAIRLRISR